MPVDGITYNPLFRRPLTPISPSHPTPPPRNATEATAQKSPGTTGEDSANIAANPAVELTDEEKGRVEELKRTDREVRAHEQAHIAAGGQYVTGGATFEYQTGPDGKRYAVGGEVSIDSSEIANDPEATIRKMQVVRKAALAPAQPSGQDRSVAAAAAQKEAQARQQVMQQKMEEAQSADHPESTDTDPNHRPRKDAAYNTAGKADSIAPSTSSLVDIFA
ncbi:MAG: hypothetical protein GF398_01245 [Chitinivibrionales bacterium]|nr:hypothetical protein [Chitinivibrionales bacterium]